MAEGEKKTSWEQALQIIRKIRLLEAKGDRTNRDLSDLQSRLRVLLGLKTPRVEKRKRTRLDRRKPTAVDRRRRGRTGSTKERRKTKR